MSLTGSVSAPASSASSISAVTFSVGLLRGRLWGRARGADDGECLPRLRGDHFPICVVLPAMSVYALAANEKADVEDAALDHDLSLRGPITA
jgi:hypothetical protein